MKLSRIVSLIMGSFFLILLGVGIGKSTNKPLPPSSTLSPQIEGIQTETSSKVSLIIDGDTIELESGQRVRLIGVDTPETVDPNRPEECYAREASAFTKSQLEGKDVKLEKDISETDRYGRLLRYVWLGDVLFNEVLVKEGYAHSSSYPPDVKYQAIFIAAQDEARNSKKGLWSSICTATIFPHGPPPSSSFCQYSCASPDRDCSDFSTHSEAQAFFNCCGFSVGNDPMRIDKATGTGNGLACESLPS